MIVGLGVTSCVAFERECGQMWLILKVLFDGVSLWCPLVGAQSNLGAHWKETLAPLISSLLPTNTIVQADIGFL